MTGKKFTHVEFGRNRDGQLSFALMERERHVGGMPNCTVADAMKAVGIIFGADTDSDPQLLPTHDEQKIRGDEASIPSTRSDLKGKSCAIFARTANDDQGGLDQQIADLRAHAKTLGMEVVYEACFVGAKEKQVSDHVDELISLKKKDLGFFDVIVLRDWTRLGRGATEAERLLAQLDEAGIEVVVADREANAKAYARCVAYKVTR